MTPPDELTDASLLRRFRAGDARAFETLFGRYERVLRTRVARMISPQLQGKVSVSDVVQETRIAAHDAFRTIETRGPGTVRGWLLHAAECEARSAARRYVSTAKRAAGRERPMNGRSSVWPVRARGPSPSEAAIASESTEAALTALAALPVDYQEVLRLARMRGLSLAEVAVCMGRSREAIKKLYARALSCFAETLARIGKGGPP